MEIKKQKNIRLNANENFYGCSPSVLKAIKKNIKSIHQYPAMPVCLEEKLAEKFGVESKNIVVGAGSVRLIDGIIQTFVEPDEEIIIFERSFVAYEQLAAAHRRKYVFAKLTDFICEIDNILPLVTKKTKVIFIANPNNPTGTIITHARLVYLLETVSKDILIVVDEAYCEYVTDKSFPDSFSLQKKYSNLIILRTFSKIYGLAGLRIGYGVMKDELAGVLKKSRIPFFFNSLSEDAALTALADHKFISLCAKKNAKEKEFLHKNFKQTGLNIIPSQGNFLYIHFDNEEEKEKIFKRVTEKGLLICNLKTFGQDRSLRIGIGNRKINKELLSSLSIH